MTKKLFAGHILRKIRERAELSQVDFARRLNLSPSYVNQLESNVRPISASVLIAVSREFGADLSSFETNDLDRLVSDLSEAFADTRFHSGSIGLQELKSVAIHTPDFARAVLDLYSALRHMSEQQAFIDDAIVMHGRQTEPAKRLTSPYEEVRDYFHYTDNYVDDLDTAAESLANELGLAWHSDRFSLLANWLTAKHNVVVEISDGDRAGEEAIMSFDPARKIVVLNRALPRSTMAFLLGNVIAELTSEPLIAAHLDAANFATAAASDICRLALRNYFAGALLLPYRKFAALARDYRHDLDRLATTSGASLEQICHRLSTLQRSGEKGVPFYFLKVDRAGNIIKRHSATRFQFARYGGSCPLWNVHEAFENPEGRFSVQHGEMPDGISYVCLATSVTKPASSYTERQRRYALGLGCEAKYADLLVYADRLIPSDKTKASPDRIGINCRICPRNNCADRAFPALDKELLVDPTTRRVVPFSMR